MADPDQTMDDLESLIPELAIAAGRQAYLRTIRQTNRAYLFDNSGAQPEWIADITDGTHLQLKTGLIPAWVQRAVMEKLAAPPSEVRP